jgi:hypothetical protein
MEESNAFEAIAGFTHSIRNTVLNNTLSLASLSLIYSFSLCPDRTAVNSSMRNA